jgi:sRNA-binding protein
MCQKGKQHKHVSKARHQKENEGKRKTKQTREQGKASKGEGSDATQKHPKAKEHTSEKKSEKEKRKDRQGHLTASTVYWILEGGRDGMGWGEVSK